MKLAVWAFALIILALIVAGGMRFYEESVLSEDAENYVLEDLMAKHPNADEVGIISWEKKFNEDEEEYYIVKGYASEGLYTPCPVRTHYFYFYPEQNFIPQPPERITRECVVCRDGTCVIAFREEAIIASHTLPGTETVATFVEDYPDAVPRVWEGEYNWIVDWDSEETPYYYRVEIRKTGTLVSIERINK